MVKRSNYPKEQTEQSSLGRPGEINTQCEILRNKFSTCNDIEFVCELVDGQIVDDYRFQISL
jgi:hypothetical protein